MNNDLYHDDIALAEAMYNNDIDMLKNVSRFIKRTRRSGSISMRRLVNVSENKTLTVHSVITIYLKDTKRSGLRRISKSRSE